MPLAFGVAVVLMDGGTPRTRSALDRRAQGHPHPHGPDHVPPAAVAARRRACSATTCRACATCCTAPRPCPVPVKRRIIEWLGPIVVRVLRRDRRRRQLRRLRDLARRTPAPSAGRSPRGQVIIGDEDGTSLPAGEIGLVYLQGAPERPVRLLQGRREDRGGLPRASTSPSATSATSTTRATCSSPTAAPT